MEKETCLVTIMVGRAYYDLLKQLGLADAIPIGELARQIILANEKPLLTEIDRRVKFGTISESDQTKYLQWLKEIREGK